MCPLFDFNMTSFNIFMGTNCINININPERRFNGKYIFLPPTLLFNKIMWGPGLVLTASIHRHFWYFSMHYFWKICQHWFIVQWRQFWYQSDDPIQMVKVGPEGQPQLIFFNFWFSQIICLRLHSARLRVFFLRKVNYSAPAHAVTDPGITFEF